MDESFGTRTRPVARLVGASPYIIVIRGMCDLIAGSDFLNEIPVLTNFPRLNNVGTYDEIRVATDRAAMLSENHQFTFFTQPLQMQEIHGWH